MLKAQCIIIDSKTALAITFIFFINGIQQSQTAINNMDISVKVQLQKNNSIDVPIEIVKNQTEISSCPTDIECSALPFPCIKCNYNYTCIYGKDINVTCERINPNINCTGETTFIRQMNCRYCYQTELWEHKCVQKGNCNSVGHYYKTNCTVHDDILCLGRRTFLRNIKCNWTQGYKWTTALIISLTLGGFGADRFYLGHWQEGIGKLFSFGGLGVWTIIDVLLISLHYLGPADGSLYI